MSKFLFYILSSCLLYLGLEQLIELKTHGFCLQRIQAEDLPYQARWDTPAPSQEIKQVLNQPFHLIGAGSECFAFMSQDGTTVIKFFKLDRFRPVYLHRGLFLEDYSAYAGAVATRPFSWRHPWLERLLGIREFRLQRTFDSIHLAFQKLKEETGLLYLHLNPGGDFATPLTLYDGSGIAHTIDLNKAKFVLQQRASPLLTHFQELLSTGQYEEAKTRIDAFIDLVWTRCQKGIADRDLINRNFGYIGSRAIEIDAGSFTPMQAMREKWLSRQELVYATLELKQWLKTREPELAHYLETRVEAKIS